MAIGVFHGTVTAGRLVLDRGPEFQDSVSALEGERITVTLAKEKRRRSMTQAAYLFGVVYPAIAEHCGYEAYEVDEVHDAVMRTLGYLRPEPNPLSLRQSLRDMDSAAQTDYIEQVRRWSAKSFGLDIADPA